MNRLLMPITGPFTALVSKKLALKLALVFGVIIAVLLLTAGQARAQESQQEANEFESQGYDSLEVKLKPARLAPQNGSNSLLLEGDSALEESVEVKPEVPAQTPEQKQADLEDQKLIEKPFPGEMVPSEPFAVEEKIEPKIPRPETQTPYLDTIAGKPQSKVRGAIQFANDGRPKILPAARMYATSIWGEEYALSNCTGFLLSIPLRNGTYRSTYVTAAHCIPGWPESPNMSTLFEVQDGVINYEFGLEQMSQYSMLKYAPSMRLFDNEDVMFTTVQPERFQLTKMHKIAAKAPAVGEALAMVGYPSTIGPIMSGCKLLGYMPKSIGKWSLDPKQNRFTIGPVMHCEVFQGSPSAQGASGGPVFNGSGEIVGIVVQEQAKPGVMTTDGGRTTQPTVYYPGNLFFTPLTSSNIALDGGYRSLKRDGKYTSEFFETDGTKYYTQYTLKDGFLDGEYLVSDGTRIVERHVFMNGFEVAQ